MVSLFILINTIIWLIAWIRCSWDGVEMIYKLASDRVLREPKRKSGSDRFNIMRLLVQQKADEVAMGYTEKYIRDGIVENEQKNRLIAVEKEKQRLLRNDSASMRRQIVAEPTIPWWVTGP